MPVSVVSSSCTSGLRYRSSVLHGDTPTEGGSDVETILVIDDQNRVRVVIREMLQMKGYTVLDTGDPQVALDLTKKHVIHLLLADVVMPLMTGPELARRVQALSPKTKAKVAEYVWRTPRFVDTPLRRALQQAPWF